MTWDNLNLLNVLKNNGVVVMPTDTLYGIVGKAQSESVVNRIYNIRKRDTHKPCIILIEDVGELGKFSIILSDEQENKLKEYWPGPVSVVLDCPHESLSYLHRGTKTLAFRVPAHTSLRELLVKVGPLIAPSANAEALPPAKSISEAKKYFGELVDLYLDGDLVTSKASKVIKLHKDGSVAVLRE